MFVCPECGLAQAQGGACPADGTALAPNTEDPIIGTPVGVYRVARLLGVGGMGRVYKGVHPQIGSRVAIKVLSRECADRPDLVERFFSEARAVNLIRHESIVNVLDLSRLPDGRPFIIMEYLDGSPLNDIVAKCGALPLGGLARLASEVLDALGAAHAKGIVHRDLKPDNIFVTPAGHPKVLDFGIAKLRPEMGGSFTQSGSLLGTPHYMSPEQAMGKPVDHRTDLYAMGVILFECATGQKPFNADSLFDLLRKHVDVAPPAPRTLRPDMPPALEQVILAALAKDPNQRFGSAAALAQALQASTAGLGADAWVPISPATVQRMTAQRTPVGGPMTGPMAGQPMAGSAPGMTPASWPPGWTPIAQQAMPGAGMHGSFPGAPPGMGVGPVPGSTPMQGSAPGMTPSTATSGQVVAKPVGSSKKGLWFALAGLVVVGGIIAIAVAAGGDESGATSGAGSAAASGSASAASAGSAAGTGAALDRKLDQLDKAVNQLDHIGSDTAKVVGDRLQEAHNRIASTTGGSSSSGGATGGSAASGGTSGSSPSGGGAASSGGGAASSGAASSGGGTAQIATAEPYNGGTLAVPGASFDPTRFDVSGFYGQAEAEARKIWPDAKLWRIDAEGVFPDGKANITLGENFSVLYRFISPKHSEPPAGTPMGVKVDQKCVIYVNVDKEEIRSYLVEWDCKEQKLIRAPKCSAAQVWQKAIKIGAPGKNAVAELGYRTDFDGNILWYFDIGDAFSQTIPDNC
jgi:serine/threonine-protein kinase